jgi:hypothetical protein
MKAKYDITNDTVKLDDNGVVLLESLYDNIRKPVFIDVIYKMSTKIGTYKKSGETYIKTNEICTNLNVLATLNIENL